MSTSKLAEVMQSALSVDCSHFSNSSASSGNRGCLGREAPPKPAASFQVQTSRTAHTPMFFTGSTSALLSGNLTLFFALRRAGLIRNRTCFASGEGVFSSEHKQDVPVDRCLVCIHGVLQLRVARARHFCQRPPDEGVLRVAVVLYPALHLRDGETRRREKPGMFL